MMDKLSALAVPPGNSLTDTPGKWPWEQPPRFTDPDDVIDYTIETISNGPIREDMLKMMLAGITVEELVEQVTFKGFLAGAFTPDVAELVKPGLAIFLADMAIQEGFEPQMFVDETPVEGEFSDENFFRVMKERNPEMFAGMVEELNKIEREQLDNLVANNRITREREQRRSAPSFLNVQGASE